VEVARARAKALHNHFLRWRSAVPGPRRFQEREAQEPVAVHGTEGERRCAAARIADEMESVEPSGVSLPHDPFDLSVETVVRWRLVPGVHLEILRDRVDTLAEHAKQRCVCLLGRQHDSRQQHDGMSGRHTSTLLPDIALRDFRVFAPQPLQATGPSSARMLRNAP
jgi:hypothetical protein